MCSGEQYTPADSAPGHESVRLAVAISLLRTKLLPRQTSFPNVPSDSDALRWKRKAKERKQELIRLREDLKEAEDASHCDLFPQSASCKCYFFDNLGKFSPKQPVDASNHRFNDVLRRRFLRQVRFKERRKADGSTQKRPWSDMNNEDEAEQLGASINFLVELCDKVSPAESYFTNWAHQAVDFILASLKSLLTRRKNMESIEGIVSSLIIRLVRRMCSPLKDDSRQTDTDSQFYIQHLIRKLGSESYIGQRSIFSVSQRISVLAESLLFTDPFDESYPTMHQCMFLMIQLIEFLISDYLLSWLEDGRFDQAFFDEWLMSVLHARKAVELLESRNGLYVLYVDRVIGDLAKQVGQVPLLQKMKPDILNNLFR